LRWVDHRTRDRCSNVHNSTNHQGKTSVKHHPKKNRGNTFWLVVYLPLWKIWKSLGRMTSHILWNIKNVWNHQPAFVDVFSVSSEIRSASWQAPVEHGGLGAIADRLHPMIQCILHDPPMRSEHSAKKNGFYDDVWIVLWLLMMEKKTSHQISRMFYGNCWEIPGFCGSLSVQLQRSHRPVGSSRHRPLRRSPPGPDWNTMEFHGFPTDFVSCSESSWVAGKNLNFNQVQLKCHDPEIQVTVHDVLNVKKHTKTTPSTCRTSKELSALMLAAVAIGKFEVKMIWALTVACQTRPFQNHLDHFAETQKKWSFCGWTSG